MSWQEWLDAETGRVQQRGQWRQIRTLDGRGGAGQMSHNGRPVVCFASNDYLGLSAHPRVIEAGCAALRRWGAGSGASRLVVGSRPIHDDLEQALAAWKHAEASLLFPTGFAANLGLLATLGGPGVTIYSDELNHASIVDGCRLSKAAVEVYRHRDVEHLRHLLGSGRGRALVVTDTVFSMDGDVAPIQDLVELCDRRGAMLVLDEAHAVLGPDTAGASAGAAVLRVGTLSKTLGALGGFVCGDRRWIELLINRARSFIFTTALTPADAAAALAAIDVVCSVEGAALVERLWDHVRRVAPEHGTPIIPIVLGDEQSALDAAATLLERGLLVPAIRPPTVAPGTSRLRVALSAAHSDDQVSQLIAALHELGLGRTVAS